MAIRNLWLDVSHQTNLMKTHLSKLWLFLSHSQIVCRNKWKSFEEKCHILISPHPNWDNKHYMKKSATGKPRKGDKLCLVLFNPSWWSQISSCWTISIVYKSCWWWWWYKRRVFRIWAVEMDWQKIHCWGNLILCKRWTSVSIIAGAKCMMVQQICRLKLQGFKV